DKENKRAAIRIGLKLVAIYEGPAEAEPPVMVAATFGLHLDIVKPISKKSLEKVAHTMGMTVVWPYWREFVQSLTVRMGLPAFPVALLNVVDLGSGQGGTEEQKEE